MKSIHCNKNWNVRKNISSWIRIWKHRLSDRYFFSNPKSNYFWTGIKLAFIKRSQRLRKHVILYILYIMFVTIYYNMLNKGNNKLPNSEQSYKGKVKTHKYINRQNQSTIRHLEMTIPYPGTRQCTNIIYNLRRN